MVAIVFLATIFVYEKIVLSFFPYVILPLSKQPLLYTQLRR